MVLRKTLLYVPAGMLGPLIQLATILVLTYWLSPSQLGIYAMVVALQDLAQIATLSWWSQYVLRYLEERAPDIRARQDRTETGILLATGVVQALLVSAFMLVLDDDLPDAELVASAALAGVLRSLVTHWSVRARAAQHIGLHAFAQIAGPGLSLAFALLGFTLLEASLTVAFLAMALAHLVVAAVMAPRVALTRLAGGIDRPILVAAYRYGAFTTLGAGLAWVSMQSVRFITDAALGTAAVGLLHVGWGIGQRIATQLGVLATTALFPIAASTAREKGIEAGVKQLLVAGPILLAVLVPATVGLFSVAEPFARLVTAPEFHDATAEILPYAMLAGAVRVFRHHYLDEILQLSEQPRIMAALDAVEALSTVVFCGIGAVFYGLLGGIVGCLIAAMLATALGLAIIARRHGPPVSLRALVATGLAAAVMLAALWQLPAPVGIGSLVAVALASGSAYAATYALVEHRALLALLRR